MNRDCLIAPKVVKLAFNTYIYALKGTKEVPRYLILVPALTV